MSVPSVILAAAAVATLTLAAGFICVGLMARREDDDLRRQINARQ